MDFMELAKRRCSVRAYEDRKVEPEKLERILEAARIAPTAKNLQPVKLLAVQSGEGLEKVGKAANIYGAPLAIIVCADHQRAWTRPFDGKRSTDIDASILTDHMMLEATELGPVSYTHLRVDLLLQARCASGGILLAGASGAGEYSGGGLRLRHARQPGPP